jgi:nucleoside-diphosphate-sugar epimerase
MTEPGYEPPDSGRPGYVDAARREWSRGSFGLTARRRRQSDHARDRPAALVDTHVADLADLFRRVLEDRSARGTYVIGSGLNPTVAELSASAAGAAGAPGAVPVSDVEARSRLGDWFASVLLVDQGIRAARAQGTRLGAPPIPDSPRNSATGSYLT